MMSQLSDQEIRTLVLDVIRELNLTRDTDQQLQLSPDAPLFGTEGPLDSLELVALAMDIEDALAERGYAVSLSDENAMSRQQSPFRNVSSLAAHLRESIDARADGC